MRQIIISNNTIELPGSLIKQLEVVELTIVQVNDCEPKTKQNLSRNVWAFDRKGFLVWKISPYFDSVGANSYAGIRLDEQGRLVAGTWRGL
jgi:outer membrane protein assembly factor BamB